jgi:hypothetical protein
MRIRAYAKDKVNRALRIRAYAKDKVNRALLVSVFGNAAQELWRFSSRFLQAPSRLETALQKVFGKVQVKKLDELEVWLVTVPIAIRIRFCFRQSRKRGDVQELGFVLR